MATMLGVRRPELTASYSPARARWATVRIETDSAVSAAVESFVALNKQYVRTIRVLNESEAAPSPRRLN
jgi:hypothetical protein